MIEGPQRTPPQAPVEISVERLPWDALLVDLGQGDGMVAPGATIPVAVGYNILTPEPTEVNVRCTAELRPVREGEPVWRDERHEVVTTNHLLPSAHVWKIPAPMAEGTYVLAVETAWEPVASPESSWLWRWIRRRRNPAAATSSSRRMTLAVVGPKPSTPGGPGPVKREQEVDTIELARLRGYRPVAQGSGAP